MRYVPSNSTIENDSYNKEAFAREEPQVWQCRNCGCTYIGKSAPLKCPVCVHPRSYFELKKINYGESRQKRDDCGRPSFAVEAVGSG